MVTKRGKFGIVKDKDFGEPSGTPPPNLYDVPHHKSHQGTNGPRSWETGDQISACRFFTLPGFYCLKMKVVVLVIAFLASLNTQSFCDENDRQEKHQSFYSKETKSAETCAGKVSCSEQVGHKTSYLILKSLKFTSLLADTIRNICQGLVTL